MDITDQGMEEEEVDVSGIVTESFTVKKECEKHKSSRLKDVRQFLKNLNSKEIKKKAEINSLKANCKDFLEIEDSLRPVAAFLVVGHSKAKKESEVKI